MKYLILVLMLQALLACQMVQPTRVRSVMKTDVELMQKNARKPIKLNKEIVLLDARSAFDYSILHLPNSINLSWEEFADHRGPFPGRLKEDNLTMTSRLARLGINPDSRVIIVGYGRDGKGEEGRLAWTLFYFGVKDVQFSNMNYFKARMTQKVTHTHQPLPIWKAKVSARTIATGKEVKSVESSIKWIDVRSQKETLKSPINNQALKIPWNDFITYQGRIDLQLKSKLRKIGLRPSDRIIVVSEKGVKSAAVVMSMLAMGFENAAHVSGGMNEYFKMKGLK